MTTWGIVSTVRGPTDDILRFVAHHLDLGVDHMYLYLDEPNPDTLETLRSYPRIRIRNCDAAFWQRRRRDRPDTHQVRQTYHASYTYRKNHVDWLAHIDLDEFLWSEDAIEHVLRGIPADQNIARVRPIEAMAGGQDLYKAHIPRGPEREALVQSLYPNYGAFVLGGFLSHVQGKLFVRTGLEKINFRIHNVFQNKELVKHSIELPQIDLCHRHAPDWDHWFAHWRFRLERGSYRPGMSPNAPRELGGLNMNELLTWIEAEHGLDGLRAFYDEMSGADPAVHARLAAQGLIKHRPLNLDAKVAKHFPGSG